MKNLLLSSFTLLLLSSCETKKTDTTAEGEKLMQISRDWSKTAASGNVDSIMSYWADDAIVMSPNESPLNGKQAIRGMIEGTSKIPGFTISWEPKSVVVSKSGDMAYLIEENKMTMADSTGKTITQTNKAVTIWRKDANGHWKNVVDMWNANPQ